MKTVMDLVLYLGAKSRTLGSVELVLHWCLKVRTRLRKGLVFDCYS